MRRMEVGDGRYCVGIHRNKYGKARGSAASYMLYKGNLSENGNIQGDLPNPKPFWQRQFFHLESRLSGYMLSGCDLNMPPLSGLVHDSHLS